MPSQSSIYSPSVLTYDPICRMILGINTLTDRGVFVNATQYVVGDYYEYENQVYIVLVAHVGDFPPSDVTAGNVKLYSLLPA